MLKWLDILRFANQGNLEPDNTVNKTEAEWQGLLTDEQYTVTRLKGTERPFSSEMCSLFVPGLYACMCCDTLLFDANEKFNSGTGWPSFTQPFKDNAVAYHRDNTYGMSRIETTCNCCGAHLGHVFPDGPEPSGLRYCINALSLKKVKASLEKATFGGGCFWCTEAVFQQLRGVVSVESGYSGGTVKNPSYKEVSTGNTGHAEVIQIVFDPNIITYRDLVKIHLTTHDPTQFNQQGADQGTQYRSVIFTHNTVQEQIAGDVVSELQPYFNYRIVTEITPYQAFFKAESYHQNYYADNANNQYCQYVIEPKLAKLREIYFDSLKS